MNERLLELKEQYSQRVEEILKKYDSIKIIYLRVSTKNQGQEESDQLPDILDLFDIKEDQCLVIKEKESAFQISKQKNRVLEIVKEIIKEYQDEEKIMYVWDLDRIYRNQEMQVDFIRESFKKNCKVLSYRQNFLYQLRELGGFGNAVYNFFIEMLAWQAQEESQKRGDRLKKSLKQKDGKYYTNKGNLFGKKYTKLNGKKANLSAQEILKIEKSIYKKIQEGISYREIIDLVANKLQLKISLGQISNIKKKYS